jgi:hypothetical protein
MRPDLIVNESTPLVKSEMEEQPAPSNVAQIKFATVSSKDFADYIKGQSNLGKWGKTVYWSCLLGTASSIVAINSNSFVSQFESQLPMPFIYFSISFLGLASFYTAFVTRFVSVGNYKRGLENFLEIEKNGSYLEREEENFFKIAFDRFSILILVILNTLKNYCEEFGETTVFNLFRDAHFTPGELKGFHIFFMWRENWKIIYLTSGPYCLDFN